MHLKVIRKHHRNHHGQANKPKVCAEKAGALWTNNPFHMWDKRQYKASSQHSDSGNKHTREPSACTLIINSLSPSHFTLPDHEFQSLCAQGHLSSALDVFSHMQQLGTTPPLYMYWSFLHACIRLKALAHAQHVYSCLLQHPFQPIIHTPLGEYVVIALVKCGSLDDALDVFYLLPSCTHFAWTAVISGYTECGQGRYALNMYQCMREETVMPNGYTFISLFRACGSICDLEEGKRLHIEASEYNCDSDLFVSAALMDMYANCGSITHAQVVFDGLSEYSVVLWTTMLSAYVKCGLPNKALQLYKQIREEDIIPDECTIASALQACSILAESEEAVVVDGRLVKVLLLKTVRAMHVDAKSKGFHSHLYVGNSLVSVYGKCGSIAEAESVFAGLFLRTVVSWTAMITVYAEHGEGKKVLRLYRQMQTEGVRANVQTFVVVLQACCILAGNGKLMAGQSFLQIGQALHADARKLGYHSNVFVGNTIMSMYGKVGKLSHAMDVFVQLPVRSLVSWNSMLSAFIDQGDAGKALQLYAQMQRALVNADQRTFVIVLQACCVLAEAEEASEEEGCLIKVRALQIGCALHDDAQKKGLHKDIFVGNSLVSMYGKCGDICKAQAVFDGLSHPTVVSWNTLLSAYVKSGRLTEAELVFSQLPQRNIVSWNSMLSAYVEGGEADKALELYGQICEERLIPTSVTFMISLQACCMLAEEEEAALLEGDFLKVRSLEAGQAIHIEAERMGLVVDAMVGRTLLTMYSKRGNILAAENVFVKLPQNDEMSCNAMLSAYATLGKGEKVLQLYTQMLEKGVDLFDTTLVCVLEACTKAGSVELCRPIHFVAVSAGYDLDHFATDILIHSYECCASMADALAVFVMLRCPQVVSWNTLIAGYSHHCDHSLCLMLFEEMKQTDMKPDPVSFLLSLSACTHAGLIDLGVEYFEYMARVYHIIPEIEHYGVMLDLLGRAGDFNHLVALLSKMPVKPDWRMWTCLLAACHKHSQVELAEHAFGYAMNIKPMQAAAYVLMSNIYAGVDLYDCA